MENMLTQVERFFQLKNKTSAEVQAQAYSATVLTEEEITEQKTKAERALKAAQVKNQSLSNKMENLGKKQEKERFNQRKYAEDAPMHRYLLP